MLDFDELKPKLFNLIFIGLMALVLLIGTVRTFAFPKDINEYENRTAEKVIEFKSGLYASGEYQDSVENALADQVPMAESFKKMYNTALSGFKNRIISATNIESKEEFKDKVIKLTDEINMVGDHLYYSKGREMWDTTRFDAGIEKINGVANNHPELNFYAYYIEREIENDFETGEKAELAEYLKTRLNLELTNHTSHFAKFEVSDFETFDKYFYNTDHHWNYLGSYKGYQEVMELLGLSKPLNPLDTIEVGWLSGSRAAGIGEASYTEIQKVYEFNFPAMKITIDGRSPVGVEGNTDGDYGSQAELIAKNAGVWDVNDRSAEHNVPYARFYGNDYAEVVLKNLGGAGDQSAGQSAGNGRRLLVFGDSYDNALLKLLASNYDIVYAVDCRWYEQYTGHAFDFDQYVASHPVDDVLFIGSNTLFENPF